MTCNNIILSQPETGAVLNHQIPSDVSARLNFGPDDISGLRLGNEGELVINFNGGGQLNITNFAEVVENGNLLYLEDGTLIDPSILTSALQTPTAFNNIETAAGAAMNGDAIRIAKPAANSTNEITMQQGQKYVCDFDPKNAATVEIKDGQMVLTFADGSQVVINNYAQAMAGDLPAQLTVEDGTVIQGDQLITQVTEVAEPIEEILQTAKVTEKNIAADDSAAAKVANIAPASGDEAEALAQIEPAAGEAGGANRNSGYGFNSSPVDVPLSSIDAIGPIGPTQLAYVAPQQQQETLIITRSNPSPSMSTTSLTLDETNLSAGGGVISGGGKVSVNFGGDGPGAILPNGNFSATCFVQGAPLPNGGNQLSSGGVPVIVTATANGYEGVVNGQVIFTFVIDPKTGVYTYSQNEPFDHSDTTNDNEPICLEFGIVVTDADGDKATTKVLINILDDAPVILSQPDGIVDETNFTGGNLSVNGQFFADPGEDTAATYTGNSAGFDADGSLANNALTSHGVPVLVTYDAATNTYTGKAGAVTVFTMTLDPATGAYAYKQFKPLDHADKTDPNDQIALHFDVTVTDFDGDKATGQITIKVLDDGPVTGDDENTIDEDSLGPIVINDKVDVNFGGDGAGKLLSGDNFVASGSLDNGKLTSGGVDVVVTKTATGYVGVAGGATVFTLEIQDNGNYTFTLNKALDHADDNNPNDVITLDFGTIISDYDGDTEPGHIIVNVKDSAPVFQPNGPQPGNGTETVDETNLVITETGKITADFGTDGPAAGGGYQPTGSFAASGSLLGDQLTSHGAPINVTYDAVTHTYTGATATATVFTLTVDPVTGDYTYTQPGVLDHKDGTNPNDIITLKFDVDAVDAEGEAAHGSIVINVKDDAPIASKSQATVDETDLAGGALGVNGQIVIDFGNDGPATTNPFDANGVFQSGGSQLNGQLTQNGVPVLVAFDADTNTYVGKAGGVDVFKMVIGSDGAYQFTQFGPLDHNDPNDPNDIIDLDFGFSVKDYDGDVANSFVRIHVKDDVPTIGDSAGNVDETNFDKGPLVYTDSVEINGGADLASISTDGNVTGSATSGGVPVVITSSPTGYVGKVNGVNAFTLTIDPATGKYVYTQFLPFDHANTNDPNDTLSLGFGVEIVGNDGSTDSGVITIVIADDGPTAVDDISGAEEGQLITGNVLANDDLSQDGGNTVTNVSFKGTDYAVPAVGTRTVNGDFGDLVIKADGTYTYTTHNDDPDGTDVFTYTLIDRDGDTDTAKLSITVTPDGQPIAVDASLAVDETNLTPGPMIFNGDLNVNFGLDGAGTVKPNGDFTPSGSLLNGTFTSGNVPVLVSFAGNIYTGKAGDVTIFTLQINDDGTYRFQLFEHVDHADGTDPNDVIKLEFGVMAADADGDGTNGTVTIFVYDDAPVAYDDGTTTLNESETVTGNVTTNDELSEDKPTNVVQVIFNGAPVNVPAAGVVSINGQYGVLTIAANGSYSYKANSNNPEGTDTFTYVLKDFDGDKDTAEVSFKVNPLDDTPIIVDPGTKTVDETDLDKGTPTVTGKINVDFGNDTPGEVNPNNTFSSTVPKLTSCGKDVVVTVENNTYVGKADGMTIFTLEILENGSYTFKLLGTIDHPDVTNPNDVITLNFGATATDSDGDSASTTIHINVLDDGPDIGQISKAVDESNFVNGQLVATGTVPHDFGEDGQGQITTNGLFEAKFQMDGGIVGLSSAGRPIVVTNTANLYTGTANGQVIFTLAVDPLTGKFTYSQFAGIDHPDTTNPNDVIWLKFYVDITDCDGDKDTGVIVIDVADDAPKAVDDVANIGKVQTSVSGNVLTNDIVGTDKPGAVTTPGTYQGTYGKLVLNADGTYTYTRTGNQGGTEHFNYTMRDADGDTSSAKLTIKVADNVSPININGVGETDDTNLKNGPDIENGVINVNYQGDTPGKTTGSNTFAPSGNLTAGKLSSHGVDVNVTFDAATNTYVGKAGTTTVFTMVIKENGTYTFTQLKALDHSITTNNNEPLYLDFGVKATDVDGDSGTGVVRITVLDDGPTIEQFNNPYNESALQNGPIVIQQTLVHNFGQDGAGSIKPTGEAMIKFALGGEPVTLTSGGKDVVISNTADGYVGKVGGETIFSLSINSQTGKYTYTQFQAVDHPHNAPGDQTIWMVFGVKITDADGDSAKTSIVIDVSDDVPKAYDDKNCVTGKVTIEDFCLDPKENDVCNFETSLTKDGITISSNKGQDLRWFSGSDGSGVGIAGDGSDKIFTANERMLVTFAKGVEKAIFTIADIGSNNVGNTFYYDVYQNGHYIKTDAIILEAGKISNGLYTFEVTGDNITRVDLVGGPSFVLNNVKAENYENTVGNVTGNVIANDDVGVDQPGSIIAISFAGQEFGVPANGQRVIQGANGTLTIKSNGDYSYVSNGGGKEDIFTYTLADGDGDTSNAKLTVCYDTPPECDIVVKIDDVCVKEDKCIDVPVVANLTGGNGNEVVTLTLTGVKSSWGFSAAGWSNNGNGTYSITLPTGQTSYNGKFTFTPPANSDVDLTGLNVKASVYDPDVAGAKVANDGFNVFVDAVADAPNLNVTLPTGTNDNPGRWTFSNYYNYKYWGQGLSYDFKVNVSLKDTDGSEKLTYVTIEVPKVLDGFGIGFNKGTEISAGIWKIEATDLSGLKLVFPEISKVNGEWWNNPAYSVPEGIHNFKVTAHTQEVNLSGTECDYTNNEATAVANVKVVIFASPLVLDLDRDGLELVDANHGVYFDINGDGIADKTGWVAKDDGFLALDKNGNGIIDSQTELFGGSTEDGFTVLGRYDSNQDGVINSQDTVWNDLTIWQDLNQDGISQSNELRGLGTYGITSISLDAKTVDYEVAGNGVSAESAVTTTSGENITISDAWFEFYNGADADQMAAAQATDDVAGYDIDGSDLFIMNAINDAAQTVHSLDMSEQDLDLSSVVEGYDSVTAAINDFVYVTQAEDTVSTVAANNNDPVAQVISDTDNIVGQTLEDLATNANVIV